MADGIGMASATAEQVAARAGVSRWTVARAFKPGAPISEQSRRRVLEAAEAMSYVPDLVAAGLASDRSGLVALLIDDFEDLHKLVVLEALTGLLQCEGWGTLLVNVTQRTAFPAALLAASQRRVDAAVLNGTGFDDAILGTALGARRLRRLVILGRASEVEGTLSIRCDDAGAMREIAAHLLAGPYRRPLFVAGPDTQSAVPLRRLSFAEAWRAGRGAVPDTLNVGQYSAALSREALRARLGPTSASDRPDVIVCENDALAIGAIDAIRFDLGLAVPGDIAVTGFDDIPLAASPAYGLTTVRQPIEEMGGGADRGPPRAGRRTGREGAARPDGAPRLGLRPRGRTA